MNTPQLRELSTGSLLQLIASSSQAAEGGALRELGRRWEAALKISGSTVETGDGVLRLQAELRSIRFRGADNVNMLLMGAGEGAAAALREFKATCIQPGRTPIVLAASEAGEATCRQALPNHSVVILGPSQIQAIVDTADGVATLRAAFLGHIPKSRLAAFDFEHPARGSMFYGRRGDLDRLLYEETRSFAISGPGRIGKTSLLMAYRSELRRLNDPRLQRVRSFDCLHWGNLSEDDLARNIACQIAGGRRSQHMTLEDLPAFMKYQKTAFGGPPELLIDEVDAVCGSAVFGVLSDHARQEYCRLLICGRQGLLKQMITNEKSPLAKRLELLRPEPLQRDEARQLLREPLQDLGVTLESEAVVDYLLNLTGCLPHFMQFYGVRLFERATRAASNVIRQEDVAAVRDDMMTQQFFKVSIQDLEDQETRVAALVLLRSAAREVSLPLIQRLCSQEGCSITLERANEVANALVIHNLLAWEKGCLRLANGSLAIYAQRHGYLEAALAELRKSSAQNNSPAASTS